MAGVRSTLTTVLSMNNTKFKKGLSGSKKSLNGFQKQIGKIGGMIAGAFAISAIARFAKEATMLAAEMQGVSVAFERIRPSIGFMKQLQEATSGTVSELNLMKRAVMASNFSIPLKELASLLEFATKRAQETGESVDFLVNSIVIGIGRKSPLILDNLGISAVDLRNKLENAGHAVSTVGDVAKAVAEIAAEAMKESGDVADTSAIKYARLAAEVQDLKAEMGKYSNELATRTIPLMTRFLRGLDLIFGAIERGGGQVWGSQKQIQDFIDTWDKSLDKIKENLTGIERIDVFGNLSENELLLESISSKIGEINQKLIGEPNPNISKFLEFVKKGLQDWVEEINKFGVGGEASVENIKNLKEELKVLTDIQETLTKGNELDMVNVRIKEINDLIKELKGNVDKLGTSWEDMWGDVVKGYETQAKGILEKWKGQMKSMSEVFGLRDEDRLNLWGALFDNDEDFDPFGGPEAWEKIAEQILLAEAQAKQFGDQIGMSLINQFDKLGVAIGKFATGAEDSFRGLGDAIMQNLGNILIMMGAQTGNLGLVLAGAAIQLGGGILRALGSNSNNQSINRAPGGEMRFRLEGNDLVTVLNRNNYSNNLNT